MRDPLEKSRRLIRKMAMKKDVARLRAAGRLLYRGNPHLPEIALTFDDGPDITYTPQVLAILQHYKVKATFFCIGSHVAAHPHLVRQAYEAGHVIGNHTYTHPNLALLSVSDILAQLTQTADAIQEVIGVRPVFFRPPYGALSTRVLAQAEHLGNTIVMWNDKVEDWAAPGVDFIIRRALASDNGTIMLLHDGEKDRSQTLVALPSIIEGLQDRGFQFVTIQDMVDKI
jgi:peptidoglycan/xylan/chitin deacetylase (PgdA/CDA1 family)